MSLGRAGGEFHLFLGDCDGGRVKSAIDSLLFSIGHAQAYHWLKSSGGVAKQ